MSKLPSVSVYKQEMQLNTSQEFKNHALLWIVQWIALWFALEMVLVQFIMTMSTMVSERVMRILLKPNNPDMQS